MFSPQFVKIIVKDIEDILLAKSCKGWGEWRVNSKFLICSYPLDARCKLKQKTFNWSPEQFFLCLMCIRFPTQISHVWYSTTLTMSFDIYLLLTNKEARDNWKNLNSIFMKVAHGNFPKFLWRQKVFIWKYHKLGAVLQLL